MTEWDLLTLCSHAALDGPTCYIALLLLRVNGETSVRRYVERAAMARRLERADVMVVTDRDITTNTKGGE